MDPKSSDKFPFQGKAERYLRQTEEEKIPTQSRECNVKTDSEMEWYGHNPGMPGLLIEAGREKRQVVP